MVLTQKQIDLLIQAIKDHGGAERFALEFGIGEGIAYRLLRGQTQSLQGKSYEALKGLLVPFAGTSAALIPSDDSILTACINELKTLSKAKQIEALKLIVELQTK